MGAIRRTRGVGVWEMPLCLRRGGQLATLSPLARVGRRASGLNPRPLAVLDPEVYVRIARG